MTLSVLFGFLPIFLLSPFAGVWADRYNRKWLIIVSDGFIAVSTVVLLVLFLNGYGSVEVLLIASAIRSFGSGIQMPAVSAVLPQIVPQKELNRVNGANGSIQAAITLISPMLSGALMNYASMESIFMVDVVTATIAMLILIFFLRIPTHQKTSEESEDEVQKYTLELKQGYYYIKSHAFLGKLFFYFALVYLMVAPPSFLTPLHVTRIFGADVWRLSALEVVFAIGMILGGLLIAIWGGVRNRVISITIAMGVMGLSTFLLGVVTHFWLYLALMGLIGVMMPLFSAPTTTLLQEKVEEIYLGRVFGIQTMISTSLVPLGMVVFGPLADVVDIKWLLLISGFFLLIIAYVMFNDKGLVKEGEPINDEDDR